MDSAKEQLSNAWVESCVDLWNSMRRHKLNVDNATIWDGFRYLYLDSLGEFNNVGRETRD